MQHEVDMPDQLELRLHQWVGLQVRLRFAPPFQLAVPAAALHPPAPRSALSFVHPSSSLRYERV